MLQKLILYLHFTKSLKGDIFDIMYLCLILTFLLNINALACVKAEV